MKSFCKPKIAASPRCHSLCPALYLTLKRLRKISLISLTWYCLFSCMNPSVLTITDQPDLGLYLTFLKRVTCVWFCVCVVVMMMPVQVECDLLLPVWSLQFVLTVILCMMTLTVVYINTIPAVTSGWQGIYERFHRSIFALWPEREKGRFNFIPLIYGILWVIVFFICFFWVDVGNPFCCSWFLDACVMLIFFNLGQRFFWVWTGLIDIMVCYV